MSATPPGSRPPLAVRLARAVRHALGWRVLEPFWGALRAPYHRALGWLSRGRGLPLDIPGVGVLRVPPGFLRSEIDALEVPMLRRMVSVLSSDACFYDVGASIGLHSLVAGQNLGPGGEIHAFEPDLPSCAQYWSNLELIRRDRHLRLARTFVSDASTVAEPLSLFPAEVAAHPERFGRQPTRHLYLFENEATTDAVGTSIPCITLDTYVEAGARAPSVIKCDIEGAELLFLRGAARTLRSHQPILFLSVHPKLVGEFGYGVDDVYEFLRALGYSWEVLNDIGECHLYATIPPG